MLIKGFKGILGNFLWMILERALQMLMALWVGTWFARQWGPQVYGQWNIALSLVAFGAFLCQWGFENLVIRDLTQKKYSPEVILGSAFFLLQGLGILSFLMVIVFIASSVADSNRKLVIVMAFSHLMVGWQILDYWLQSQFQRHWLAWIKILMLCIFNILRVILLWKSVALIYFAILLPLELVGISFFSWLVYKKIPHQHRHWQVDFDLVKHYLSEGSPLLLQSLMVILYSLSDQIMLEYYKGYSAVGEYVAGRKLPDMWCFIPGLLITTVYPKLFIQNKDGMNMFSKTWKISMSCINWMGIIFALSISFICIPTIQFFYGDPYSESAKIMEIQSWSVWLMGITLLGNKWYIQQGFFKMMLWRTFAALLINIGLNIWMIPRWGSFGAALSTFVAQFFLAWVFDRLFKSTSILWREKINSFVFPFSALLFKFSK